MSRRHILAAMPPATPRTFGMELLRDAAQRIADRTDCLIRDAVPAGAPA